MKRRIRFFLPLIFAILRMYGEQTPVRTRFEEYFLDDTLRIDYFHAGDAKEEWVTFDQFLGQKGWAGSVAHLVDSRQIGHCIAKVLDADTERLIFSKSYNTYFGEYQTTATARRGEKRTFHETVLIPFPKKKIVLAIDARDSANHYRPLLRKEIDPAVSRINREDLCRDVKIFEVLKNGPPHEKVDLVLVAEGYTREQENKFTADVERVRDAFFRQEPYRRFRAAFNIWGVFKPSAESGVDEPDRGVFRNTAVQSSFDSLGLDRYLLTEDNRSLRDITACVPCDVAVILANHSRYGGGGIYNFYCIFTVDSQVFDYLLLHEFGHAFAGLADEYFTSAVAYNEFYPAGIEPQEPNITALLDPANIKWKEWLSPKIPIPTPWGKAEYEKINLEFQKKKGEIDQKIVALAREGNRESEILNLKGENQALSQKNEEALRRFFRINRYLGQVGAFEGAGYASQGLYRPMLDCLMFSLGIKPYCRVCEEAIAQTIAGYGP